MDHEGEHHVALPLNNRGMHIDLGYRLDLCVIGTLTDELKASKEVYPVHLAQVLTN